jgi:tetratricopeptide (TPR) repeat protein
VNKKISIIKVGAMILIVACAGLVSGTTIEEANKAYNSASYFSAVKLYRAAANEGESPALCYYNIANCYFQLDSLPQAIVYYRACVQDAPDFLKGHLNLAVCYYSLDDLGRCLATIRRVLELDPMLQKALMIQAAALRRCGATAKTAVAFENIIRLYPQIEEPYIALGEIYRDLGDNDVAIRWLESFPSGGKNSTYVYMLLADLYEKAGDANRAIYELYQAFNLDKSRRWTLYRITLLQQQSGNELVALETCREGLKLFPDFGEMAALAGSIAFDHERMDDAEALFNQGAAHGSPSSVVGLTNVRNWRKAHEAEQL